MHACSISRRLLRQPALPAHLLGCGLVRASSMPLGWLPRCSCAPRPRMPTPARPLSTLSADFVYVTSGFGLLFSLILLAPAIGTLRGGQDRFLEVRRSAGCCKAPPPGLALQRNRLASVWHLRTWPQDMCAWMWLESAEAPLWLCTRAQLACPCKSATRRPPVAPLHPALLQAIFGSLSLFGAFWWMVLAITITSEPGRSACMPHAALPACAVPANGCVPAPIQPSPAASSPCFFGSPRQPGNRCRLPGHCLPQWRGCAQLA